MADEIQYTFALQLANGGLADRVDSHTRKITQSTPMKHCPCVTVGTSEEDLAIGDVTAASGAWLCLSNLDATNFVKYGPKAAGAMVEFGRLKPGQKEAWFFLAPSVTLRWIADTAACKVDVRMYEA